MKSRQRITISQTQRLALNTGLVASLRLLQADAAGLSRYLEEQATENPALVLERPLPTDWLPRWTDAFARDGRGVEDRRAVEDGRGVEDVASAGPSLIAHVLGQITAMGLPPQDRRLAMAFVEALEPTGWLGRPVAAIAATAGVPVTKAEALLARLQRLDPAGLFARSLAECLRVQAEEAGVLDDSLARMLDNLALVAQGDAARVALALRLPEAEVLRLIRVIRGFDPKPGAQFATLAAPLREPDLVARKGADGWQIALNHGALPAVRLADKTAVKTAGAAAAGHGRSEAKALIRFVDRRNATLLAVGREILVRQEAALDAGPGALRPMTMADVADALRLNQSTVSRVVAGAAVDTPRGTWWLRALFTGAAGEDGPSAAALRERLARLVAREDPTAPLSDMALATALGQDGAEVARRTVAKYRDMLKIAPSHQRRVVPLGEVRKGDRKGRAKG